ISHSPLADRFAEFVSELEQESPRLSGFVLNSRVSAQQPDHTVARRAARNATGVNLDLSLRVRRERLSVTQARRRTDHQRSIRALAVRVADNAAVAVLQAPEHVAPSRKDRHRPALGSRNLVARKWPPNWITDRGRQPQCLPASRARRVRCRCTVNASIAATRRLNQKR